jgi:FixJ family two-component response regulator
MPDLSGLDLQQELAGANVDLPIIFVTGHADIPMSVRAMKAGAIEFLTKPFREQDLLDAIQHGIGQHRATREWRSEMRELKRRLALLTPREREVLPLVAGGLLNKQIADQLGASEKTIKIHRSQLMRKMKADSFADLVRMAERLKGPPPKVLCRRD